MCLPFGGLALLTSASINIAVVQMYPGATINARTWDVLCGSMLKGPQTTSKQ